MIPQHHPNWIEINLDALISNLNEIRRLIEPGTKVLLPVKAHAYGHGIVACSLTAQKCGVDMLGVAHAFEAIPLRKSGVHIPILVLGPLLENDFEMVVEHQLTPSITNLEIAKKFNAFLKNQKLKHKAQIKIDTGMNRYGVPFQQGEIKKYFEFSNLIISGVYSHMANGEKHTHPSNRQQIERFNYLLQQIPKGLEYVHLANSATLLNFPDAHYNMVRPGLMSYGYSPFDNRFLPKNFKSVMRLRATVRQVHSIRKGEGASYGHKWIASKDSTLASVALGYGDGLNRHLPEDSKVFIQNTPCPIVGTVCMDTILVDVSALKKVNEGDVVDVFNRELSPSLSIEWNTYKVGTIPYEQTCRMARRLYRLYEYKGEIRRWDEIKEDLGFKSSVEVPVVNFNE